MLPRYMRHRLAQRMCAGAAILTTAFVWAYWSTLAELVQTWNREPDYSHGFFVFPLACMFLWIRRDRFPAQSLGPEWAGVTLIAVSLVLRALGAQFFLGTSVDGWSILLWTAGAVWLLGGRQLLWWALPSILFLFFMIPLPFRAESLLSLPLQHVATRISTTALQCLGQAALAEGTTIFLGEQQMHVAQACSGLRIFMGIIALAFAFVIVVRRPLWEKTLLLLSTLPIALIANSARLVITGILYQRAPGETARHFFHDVSGWLMIPFAATLFALVLWFLGRLMRKVELIDVGELVRRQEIS